MRGKTDEIVHWKLRDVISPSNFAELPGAAPPAASGAAPRERENGGIALGRKNCGGSSHRADYAATLGAVVALTRSLAQMLYGRILVSAAAVVLAESACD